MQNIEIKVEIKVTEGVSGLYDTKTISKSIVARGGEMSDSRVIEEIEAAASDAQEEAVSCARQTFKFRKKEAAKAAEEKESY